MSKILTINQIKDNVKLIINNKQIKEYFNISNVKIIELKDNFSNLPEEIIKNELIPKLDIDDLFNLCFVSKKLKQLCTDQKIWKKLLISKYPNYYNKRSDGDWYQIAKNTAVKGMSLDTFKKIFYKKLKERDLPADGSHGVVIFLQQAYITNNMVRLIHTNQKVFNKIYKYFMDKTYYNNNPFGEPSSKYNSTEREKLIETHFRNHIFSINPRNFDNIIDEFETIYKEFKNVLVTFVDKDTINFLSRQK